MKNHLRNTAWIFGLAVLAVVIFSIVLLLVNGALPARAALPPAITNPQKAAIQGAHTLLLTNNLIYTNYLPLMTR